MSNIYIQEPSTNGKVLLHTTVGDIDIELWSKEAPKACRNFVQLCMEGYYSNTIFHRVVPEFIVQGGDPTGTGMGGESIYGKPFKDEIHSRLRFTRRGLVAMANAGPNDNSSQFFFTLGAAPELNNKHTLFGKVSGDTIYNMIKLGDCEVGENDRPIYPHKILKTKILSSPFDDIIPRILSSKKDRSEDSHKKKSTAKATKNFNLLSFGEEAEEDEEEVDKASQMMRGKSKSSHDLLDDEKLSAQPAIHTQKRKSTTIESDDSEEEHRKSTTDSVRKKLKTSDKDRDRDRKDKKEKEKRSPSENENTVPNPPKTEEPPTGPSLVEKKADTRLEELRKEQEALKRDIIKQKQGKEQQTEEKKSEPDPHAPDVADNDIVASYKTDMRHYVEKRKLMRSKSDGREDETLAILAQFKSKLTSVQQLHEDEEEEEKTEEKEDLEEGEAPREKRMRKESKDESDEDEDENNDDISWLGHKLKFDVRTSKVLDANVDDAERYEIYDPRNPLNKRRREASKQAMNKKR